MNCTLDPLACINCQPVGNNVKCLCHEIKSEQIFTMDNSLPFDHNGLVIQEKDGQLMASPALTAATLELKLKGFKLKTEVQLNNCKIEKANLSGCYDCQRGTYLEVECFTDFGDSLANVICPSAKFFTQCSPKGTHKTLSLPFTHAEVDEQCDVYCGTSSSKFQLKAQLALPEVTVDSDWTLVGSPSIYPWTWRSWFEEFRGFDFLNLFKYFFVPKHLLLAIVTIIVLFFILNCFLPTLLHFILRMFLQSFLPRSVATNRKAI